MHILVVTQFFPPEMGAPAARFGDFARFWRGMGHRVTVLTTWPNAPRGRVIAPHRQRAWTSEDHDGVRVIRTPVLALGDRSTNRKALLYASFAVSALLQGALRRLAPDVVIGTAPPPTVAYVSLLLAQRFGVPHVLDIRDIWPEALLNSGRVRPSLAMATVERLNTWVLRSSAATTTVTAGKCRRLEELGAPADRVHLIPNGVDLNAFDRATREHDAEATQVLEKAGVPPGARLLTYAGVFNPPQGLDLVLDMAATQSDRTDEPLHILLVGDGQLRDHLQRRISRERLKRVHMAAPVRSALVAPIYGHSWASLVVLRRRADTHTIPSKLYECMAARRPTVVSADGEAAELARTADCGPVAAAGTATGLKAQLDALVDDKTRAEAYAAHGRAYVEAHNDRAALSVAFMDVLARVVAP